MAVSWAWTEEKRQQILLAGCWRCLGMLASSDIDAPDFPGWAWLDPTGGDPAAGGLVRQAVG